MYTNIKYKTWEKILSIATKISPTIANKMKYYMATGKKLNLKRPSNFNEKVVWLNLYWQHDLIFMCADKVRVQEYCKMKNVPEITNKIYTVAEDANNLNWEILPNKFVLKTNNSSGTNIVVLDKDKLDKEKAIQQLNEWLSLNYSLYTTEIHYQKIVPLAFAEKFIESKTEIPIDYKFFCFNGEPKFLSVIFGRSAESLKEDLVKVHYNLDWERIYIQKEEFEPSRDISLKKPKHFKEMIKYAKILSEEFPFVRIDFYEGSDNPILGEMTFTPSGGKARYYTDEWLQKLGDEITLPNPIIKSDGKNSVS